MLGFLLAIPIAMIAMGKSVSSKRHSNNALKNCSSSIFPVLVIKVQAVTTLNNNKTKVLICTLQKYIS